MQQSPLSTPAVPITDIGEPPPPRVGLAWVGGLVVALLGAVLWASLPIASDYEGGFSVLVVGFMIGTAMQWLAGRGSITLGIGAALLTLFCTIGANLLRLVFLSAEGVPLGTALLALTPETLVTLYQAHFGIAKLLVYALGMWAGFSTAVGGKS